MRSSSDNWTTPHRKMEPLVAMKTCKCYFSRTKRETSSLKLTPISNSTVQGFIGSESLNSWVRLLIFNKQEIAWFTSFVHGFGTRMIKSIDVHFRSIHLQLLHISHQCTILPNTICCLEAFSYIRDLVPTFDCINQETFLTRKNGTSWCF